MPSTVTGAPRVGTYCDNTGRFTDGSSGVSLITQILYAVVFCTRYLNVFREHYLWNLCFKIFYITSSFYIIGIMRWVYPRTREKELAWKIGAVACVVSVLLSPLAMLIFDRKVDWGFEFVRPPRRTLPSRTTLTRCAFDSGSGPSLRS